MNLLGWWAQVSPRSETKGRNILDQSKQRESTDAAYSVVLLGVGKESNDSFH